MSVLSFLAKNSSKIYPQIWDAIPKIDSQTLTEVTEEGKSGVIQGSFQSRSGVFLTQN